MSATFNNLGTSGVDIGSGASLELTAWTIAMWVRPQSFGLQRFVDDSDGGGSIRLLPDSGGYVSSLQVTNATSAESSGNSSGVSMAANTWYFIAATYDNAGDRKIRHYVGTEAAAASEDAYGTQTAGSGTITTLGARTLILGNRGDYARGFDGQMCHVGVWNTALNLTNINSWRTSDSPTPTAAWLNLMNATDLTDSVNGNNGTATLITTSAANPSVYTPGGGVSIPAILNRLRLNRSSL